MVVYLDRIDGMIFAISILTLSNLINLYEKNCNFRLNRFYWKIFIKDNKKRKKNFDIIF